MSIKITNKPHFITFWTIILILVAGGALLIYTRYIHPDTGNPNDYLTLKEAAGMGEVANYKLMVQIENPKGNPEDETGRYQRGDIVLILPASHEFSPAEKSGFLIIQMDLTQKQTELLTMSLDEIKRERDENGQPKRETLKRRKFTVDLAKLGIGPEVQNGREIEDKTFKWEEVIKEKTNNH